LLAHLLDRKISLKSPEVNSAHFVPCIAKPKKNTLNTNKPHPTKSHCEPMGQDFFECDKKGCPYRNDDDIADSQTEGACRI